MQKETCDSFFFFEDEVFRVGSKKKHVKFGMVVKTYDSNSADEEDDYESILPKGHVEVTYYPSGTSAVLSENEIGLADRNIMPPDIVRRVSPQTGRVEGQSGYVCDVKIFVDMRILSTNLVIRNVSTEKLRPLNGWTNDGVVYLDGWVGSLKKVEELAILRCDNGARFELPSSEYHKFYEMGLKSSNGFGRNSGEIFFAGNNVICYSLPKKQIKLLTPEIPLPTNKKAVTNRYVVESVKTVAIIVNWQYLTYDSNSAANNQGSMSPLRRICGSDLERVKRVNIFENSMVQISDRLLVKFSKNKEVLQHSDWLTETAVRYRALKEQQDRLFNKYDDGLRRQTNTDIPKKEESLTNRININNERKTTPNKRKKSYQKKQSETENDDTDWDSLDEDNNADDVFNSPMNSHNKTRLHKLRTTKRKIKAVKKMFEIKSRKNCLPKENEEVIAEVILVNSFVTVVWQDGTVETNIPSVDLYPIHYVDNHEFFPGDFVIAENASTSEYGVIQRVNHNDRTALVKWFEVKDGVGSTPKPEFKYQSEKSVYELKDHDDFQYRPGTIVVRVSNDANDSNYKAGQVKLSNTDGSITICWANGCITDCYPQDLFDVGHNALGVADDDNSIDLYSEDGEISWESLPTEDENEANMPVDLHENSLLCNIYSALIALKSVSLTLKESSGEYYNDDFTDGFLMLYKDCRYIDRLLNTTFFDEKKFEGIINRKACKNEVDEAKRLDQGTSSYNEEQGPTATKRKCTNDTPRHESQRKRSDYMPATNITDDITDFQSLLEDEKDTEINSEQDMPSKTPYSVKIAKVSSCLRYSIEMLPELVSQKDNESNNFDAVDRIRNYQTNFSEYQESANEYTMSEAITLFCSKLTEQLESCLVHIYKTYFNVNSDGTAIVPADAVLSPGLQLNENQPEGKEVTSMGTTTTTTTTKTAEVVEQFIILDKAPTEHHYAHSVILPNHPIHFYRAIYREHMLLRNSLPQGIKVVTYEDRMDLLSVMMEGPKKTPYEDALFFFDMQLGCDYPKSPPLCHYISFCKDRLNPNLYEEGKVCVSLLGTWAGKDTEVWSSKSTLLQLLVSIQGLILVDEPYYNEAGYEKQKGTAQGHNNSRMYNEMTIIKVMQSTTKQFMQSPSVFTIDLLDHFAAKGAKMFNRIKLWRDISIQALDRADNESSISGIEDLPEFPLLPCSRGFCLAIESTLNEFKETLNSIYDVNLN